MTQFTDLGLSPALLRALGDEGYVTPTPIQVQAIPHVMGGRDLVGIAQTGTGKTAAFALPILHRLAADKRRAEPRSCRALILSPTRELASQIGESFRTYGRHMGMSVALIFGGMPIRPQARALERGVDIVVATPGRLLDHVNQGAARLDKVEIFVLDEADRMLDMGFIRDIRKLTAKLPRQRQNLFFSATMPGEIASLAAELLHDPVRVAVTPEATTVDKIDQRIVFVEAGLKRALLAELLGDKALARALVFTRTKHGADKVVKYLQTAGIGCDAIHGNKSQGQRERALGGFRNGRTRVLIATDIAARGIDVDGVTHVINFDLPNIPESYVHRIGRTARAGATGIAISFCAGDERPFLKDIEKLIRRQIPSEDRRGRLAPVDAPKVLESPDFQAEAARPQQQHQHRRPKPAGGQRPSHGPKKAYRGGGQGAGHGGGGHGGGHGPARAADGQPVRQHRKGQKPRPAAPSIEAREADLSRVAFLRSTRAT